MEVDSMVLDLYKVIFVAALAGFLVGLALHKFLPLPF
jgi:hypothetical protein